LEESDCGLIEVIYLYLRGGSEENHVRRQWRQLEFRPRCKPNTNLLIILQFNVI
jgi:hypothetical protein